MNKKWRMKEWKKNIVILVGLVAMICFVNVFSCGNGYAQRSFIEKPGSATDSPGTISHSGFSLLGGLLNMEIDEALAGSGEGRPGNKEGPQFMAWIPFGLFNMMRLDPVTTAR
jgi:hypothetical protein